MKFTRQRYQNGSIRRVSRKTGADVWEYRFRNHAEPGSPMRQMTLSTLEFPTETQVLIALQSKLLTLNGPASYRKENKPTLGLVIDRFIESERLIEIAAQPPGEITITDGVAYSTASGYLSYLRKHIRPRWGICLLANIDAMEVQEWLRTLALAPKTRGHIRNLMSLMFDRARLWKLATDNPMGLVKVKGISKRLKRRQILTVEEFMRFVGFLDEPHKTMSLLAMATGLRASEILALTWERINLKDGTMLVSQGAVSGRIGPCKTEDSVDEVPLHPDLAQVLRGWRTICGATVGLVFPSSRTGGCQHAGQIQQNHLRVAGRKIGMEGVGWHSFRHTYRSLLDETGAPIGVQQRLMRHAQVSTTMNIYGNAAMKSKRDANSKVVEMLIQRGQGGFPVDKRSLKSILLLRGSVGL
jgi:integrase